MSKVPILCRVQARYPFNSNDPSSLSFQQGDFIEVLTKLDSGWWDGWCNGVRGWFPSNYVQIIDDYEQEDDTAEHRGSLADPRLHREENFTRYTSTSDESDIVTPRTKNGVPLRTNHEYRLSLPYQGLDPPDLSKSSMAQVKTKPMLPPNWSLQMTEDGSECYYYNHVTGEMRSTHPEDVSDTEIDDNASYGVNGSIDDEEEEEEDYDFKSVDSRPWEERTPDDSTPEKQIPSPWMKRTNSQGRICYFNPVTNQMVVDLSEIDPSTGKIKSDEQWRPPLPDDPPTPSIPPKPLPRSPSRQTSVRRTSVIDNNEPLTWNKLSAHIALAIHNLNTAAKNGQRTLFIPNAAAIVNAIRMMLITSGTIDKESVYIKGNSVLRAHHRAMMASMSKLVLSSQLSADSTSENIGKMLSDSNELLLAVRNFVTTCQEIPVAVQHMDPILTDKAPRKAGDSSAAAAAAAAGAAGTPRTKYTLQSDLADNLETYGASMHESLEAMLQSIRRDVSSEESRFSLAALVFTQFRNLANQTAQFIGIIEDIDYNGMDESPNVLELRRSRQRLSDGLGTLFCWMQSMTDERTALKNVVSEMENASTSVSNSIRSICSCVGQLVRERGKSTPATPTSNQAPLSPSPAAAAAATTTTSTNLADSVIHEEEEEGALEKEESPAAATESISETATTSTSALEESESKATSEAVLTTPGSPTAESVSPPASVTSGLSAAESTRSPTTATGSQSKATSRKLQKFFGDDAPAAVAAASKPSVNERMSFLEYDYEPNEIVFNMEGYVKGGTLPALVERLTLHDYLDMNFINTFLLTYRSFCSSMELLNLLKARYNLKVPEGLTEEEEEMWTQKKLKLVRLRVFNVLKNWLELYYNEDDHIILEPLEEFTATSIRSSSSFSADQLEKLIRMRKEDQSQGGLKKMVLTLPDPPEPILPRNRKKLRLMDIDTLEMARQLTIMDFNLYSSIRPVECLDKAWSKDSGDDTNVAVNIRASIEYCNEVTSWVSDAILSQSDIKKRSNVIKHWVQVAEKCRLLNNFNTCMAILSAFDNSSVGRLKRTWEMVGARTNQTLSQIRKLMGANRNFTEYRAIIHSINPPCIPFLGIYLQDLTFIEDGNPNYLKKSKELINFAKRAKTAEVIREIQQYQSSLYRLRPVEELQQFIQANLQSTRDEEQLYNESLKLEPREREDEKITRLLQESGFL